MTTAVKVVCQKGHRIADVSPFPGNGPATQMEIVRRPARYRPGVAPLIAPGERSGSQAWETLPEKSIRLDLDVFSAGAWGVSVTWACRCGLNRMDTAAVIQQAWLWSTDRRRMPDDPPPRITVLQRPNAVG